MYFQVVKMVTKKTNLPLFPIFPIEENILVCQFKWLHSGQTLANINIFRAFL